MATKILTREYLDEALASFRLSLNKDLARLATKEDLVDVATKSDLKTLKAELIAYVHEVAEQVVTGFSDTMEGHLNVYHGKKMPATN